MLREMLDACPLIAILRGLAPSEAIATGRVLVEEGIRIIEVPLNSPEPFNSIRLLAETFGDDALIGAGTVLRPDQCVALASTGARLMVAPNFDARTVQAAQALNLFTVPGVGTVSEAFAAIEAGADALKLFPAETLGPVGLKAWRAVLPPEVRLLPVGGVTPGWLEAWHRAGAGGFGVGSALYRPGIELDELRSRAKAFVGKAQELGRK
ncbi:2-dehydro-3-deoxy-6-phosphogalactonate aldolase [Nitratireductor soli]|uniref:2-dehydro-3-deoxy-6-phosphogalactonate aldolase n=1 Tax=Nitratireductor soli TaxID=1670619 RepID=UPI000AB86A05|nr:2-dehydro-3-deoxy-6-phosphogalactonate aldolase [Nitratireductor soli]